MAKSKKALTKAERTGFALDYGHAMDCSEMGLKAGGGWPALWELEDIFIKCQGLPDENIERRDLPDAELSDALAPIIKAIEWSFYSPLALSKPPWTWTPLDGALADPFARMLRWAYHYGYPQPMEMVSEDWVVRLLERSRTSQVQEEVVGLMSEERPEDPHAGLKRKLSRALAAGRLIERQVLLERAAKFRASAQSGGGRRLKGIPRDASPEKGRKRDIRRAVLVAFLSKCGTGLPITHEGSDSFHSVC